MTKQEAITAMQSGKKVSHDYFGDNEWVTIKDGKIYSEDGVEHHEFWDIRFQKYWDDNWSVFPEMPSQQEWDAEMKEWVKCLNSPRELPKQEHGEYYFDNFLGAMPPMLMVAGGVLCGEPYSHIGRSKVASSEEDGCTYHGVYKDSKTGKYMGGIFTVQKFKKLVHFNLV